jgi:type II restriction enzyme
MPVTVQNLVHAISQLNRNVDYNYASVRTKTHLRIHDVAMPNGPIFIKRYDPAKDETLAAAKVETISTNMIARLAAAITERTPINVDRLFGGSYNTRSALETLVANTPNFWMCYPGRIEQDTAGEPVIKKGHKHIIQLAEAHPRGEIHQVKVDMVISESLIPKDVVYEGLKLPSGVLQPGMDINVARRHAQIQVALLKIGQQLKLDTWIAQNDHGIIYDSKRLIEHPGTVQKLGDIQILTAFPAAAHAARLIDAIWFRGTTSMPAVIEVEHSTGITSGLTRMKGFKDALPMLGGVRWVIAAEESLRPLAIREANRAQFVDLDARFISYDAVEELFSLCDRRKLGGITDAFLDSFMERLVQP